MATDNISDEMLQGTQLATETGEGQAPGTSAPDGQPAQDAPQGETITYGDTVVPIRRAGMPEMFIALEPPDAAPYVMCPRDADPQAIVKFFGDRVAAVEELRVDMRKRYQKNKSEKCLYHTGDVAYVMGRPFMLRVYPLGQRKIKSGARGRATAKYSINPELSLLTLYVVHSKNYDEAKLAFMGYAEGVIMRNAKGLVADCCKRIGYPDAVPPVKVRAMRNKFSAFEAGCLWLSSDLVPYPPDCLVYVIWREMMDKMGFDAAAQEKHLDTLMDWREAQRLLAERPKPYSNQ